MLLMLITVLVICAVAYACFWLIDYAVPIAPFNMIAKIIIAIIAIVAILQKSGLGAGLGL